MSAPIACDLSAIPPESREHHAALAKRIFAQVGETKELADGYAFQFPFDLWADIAEWLPLERRCCPFFTFRLEVAPEGLIGLSLTGPAGVKELLQAELSL